MKGLTVIFSLLLLQCVCVHSMVQRPLLLQRSTTGIDRGADLVSDGVQEMAPRGFRVKTTLQTGLRRALSSSSCDETYGFMPCTTSSVGNLFLLVVYGYLMFQAATFMSNGSELLLSVMGPGIIGGLFLPILGAFPDALLVLANRMLNEDIAH